MIRGFGDGASGVPFSDNEGEERTARLTTPFPRAYNLPVVKRRTDQISSHASGTDQWVLAHRIKDQALGLGFDLAGIAPAQESRYCQYLRTWLDDGKAGTMEYLAGNFQQRIDPRHGLDGAKSIICVAINYFAPLVPRSDDPQHPHGRIARYALGDDYHDTIKTRLHVLADWLREQAPGIKTRVCVDTAPVLEKELASLAGLTWIGKNTCAINHRLGSWLLLGEVLTTLELATDAPQTDHCGSCCRCIDACPTGAITAPYQIDARRCISYLTIEHRQPLDASQRHDLGPWLYGCDICQDVCPFNAHAPVQTDPAFHPRFPTGSLELQEVISWEGGQYAAALRRSAMKRAKLPVLQRNAEAVKENQEKGKKG